MVHQANPVAFYLFDLPITWYWLFYPLGFFIVYLLARLYLRATFKGFQQKDFIDFCIALWVAAIVGGRLGYFFIYQPKILFQEPLSVFEIWRGGMSFHGAFIGCLLAAYFLKKYKNFPIFTYGQGLLLFVPFAIFLGRIGNYLNGELWGTPTDLPWGMIFQKADGLIRHPSQIYEAITEGPLLFLLLWYSRFRIHILTAFLFFYGFLRFFTEFSREPDRHIGYIFGLSLGQYLCLAMILASFFVHRYLRAGKPL